METALTAAPTHGDLVLLDRMVANLVDNAGVADQGDVIARARPAGGLDVSILLSGNGSDMTKNSCV